MNQFNLKPKSLCIAVILPAYNEELTIESTIEAFNKELPNAFIWVVNNLSTDATETLASNKLKSLNCNGGVLNEYRKGKGNAVRRAFMDTDADIYILADADMTYPAEKIHDLLFPVIKNNADMVVGDRHSDGHYAAENKRSLHGFGNHLVKFLVNKLFHARLVDIMSGYRVFSRRFVKSYPILVDGFEIETDLTLHALDKRFRVIEIPVDYKDRPEGSVSKLNTFADGARVLFTIAQILRFYKPLKFFSLIGLIFCLLGFIAGFSPVHDYLISGYVYHLPFAVLAVGFEILSMVSFSVGLILDSINYHHKMLFEARLLDMTHFRSGVDGN